MLGLADGRPLTHGLVAVVLLGQDQKVLADVGLQPLDLGLGLPGLEHAVFAVGGKVFLGQAVLRGLYFHSTQGNTADHNPDGNSPAL